MPGTRNRRAASSHERTCQPRSSLSLGPAHHNGPHSSSNTQRDNAELWQRDALLFFALSHKRTTSQLSRTIMASVLLQHTDKFTQHEHENHAAFFGILSSQPARPSVSFAYLTQLPALLFDHALSSHATLTNPHHRGMVCRLLLKRRSFL